MSTLIARSFVLAAALGASSFPAVADVGMPAIFGDGMVLQHGVARVHRQDPARADDLVDVLQYPSRVARVPKAAASITASPCPGGVRGRGDAG